MGNIKAYAAKEAGAKLEAFEYDPGELRPEQIEIKVLNCAICHSDLSMLNNEWNMTAFPFVGGHEVVGEVIALGENAKGLSIGDKVGVGWSSESCGHCHYCISGDPKNCGAREQTIVRRHGGFADRLRCHWGWAIKLPDGPDVRSAAPLFCAGVTVFSPFFELGIKPTDKVGVVGIGGLGHLALQFADKWGCEVTAFSTSESKADEAKNFGADFVVDTHSERELESLKGKFDLILVTSNQPLNWKLYFKALSPRGKLHVVGVVAEPFQMSVSSVMSGGKMFSASGTGNPSTISTMLEFCARHSIKPITEKFPMSQINEAFDHLRSGKARYRIVLENDF